MKKAFLAVMVMGFCAVATATDEHHGTRTEPSFVNGKTCRLVVPGTPSRTAQSLVIWNFGHGIVDAEYNTDRPDLFAILPGTQHLEPGQPGFDHDHVLSHEPGDVGYNGTWDIFIVPPGPNFNPATYVAPRSLEEMYALIDAGVLAGPFMPSELGLPNFILRAPIASCD